MTSATASSSSTAACASPARSDARSTCSPSDAAPLFSRRAALIGGLAAGGALAFGPAAQAAFASREFVLLRGGSEIGTHKLTVSEAGSQLRMRIDINIRVRVLGVTAYRYAHVNQEVWQDGALVSLESKTTESGEEDRVSVRRTADGLRIEGTGFTGLAPKDAAPTSYWNLANFDTATWISTQTGKLFDMRYNRSAWTAGGQRIDATDGAKFKVAAFYDAAGEWRGMAFDGRGSEISYRQTGPGPAFRPMIG